jgi:hypothetical protein
LSGIILKGNRRNFLEIGGFCLSVCAGGLRKCADKFFVLLTLFYKLPLNTGQKRIDI